MSISSRGAFFVFFLVSAILFEKNFGAIHLTSADETAHPIRLVFLGDSLTAGFGLDLDEAYPALIQDKIAALGKNVKVVNAGLSGDTTAGGLRRLDWLLKEPIDILVIALGANDGLRGVPAEATKENLRAIIRKAKAASAATKIILAGMKIPPNEGRDYAEQFTAMYPALEKEEQVILLPFLLEGVAGNPDLNQSDGIHPTAEGQKIVAGNVWRVVAPLLPNGLR